MAKAQPQINKGRRFWSGLSRERKVIFAIAGLFVVVAVVAVPVWVFIAFYSGPDKPSTPSFCSEVQPCYDMDNPDYKAGYEAGKGLKTSSDRPFRQQGVEAECNRLAPTNVALDAFVQGCVAGAGS
jgi:hypothetical protein